jgi:hypothetical protein
MSSTEGQQSLVKLMTGIVVLTGGLCVLSWFATNPGEQSASLTAIARTPASLVGMALAVDQKPVALHERTSILEFDCSPPESASVTPETRQVRLSGKLCANLGTESAEILNVTNGFTATIFTPTHGAFMSDYIHLADGMNRLRVTYIMTSGERRVREFAITRL